MAWFIEFIEWFALVALAFGGPVLYQRYLSPHETGHRKLASTERRVRQLREATDRFERLRIEQRSLEARQAALDRSDLEHLATLHHLCANLAARAKAERRTPGSTTLALDIEALLDAAASLGDEYTRSASLARILELYVQAGLHEHARSHARWVTDATVRDRLFQDPQLAPMLRRDGPSLLLLRTCAPAPTGGDAAVPSSDPTSTE